jgi:hypothetical protein
MKFKLRAPSILLSASGSILIFVMIGLGLIMAIIFSALNHSSIMYMGVSGIHAQTARAVSLEQIDSLLRMEGSLVDSITLPNENQELKACIDGGSTPACAANCCVVKPNGLYDFIFVSPLDTKSSVEQRARLVGKEVDPVYYKKDGTFCDNKTESNVCAFKVTGQFQATCPGDEDNCDHAEHLKLTLKQTPTGKVPVVKAVTKSFVYFVKQNYQPSATNDTTGLLNMAVGSSKELKIFGDSGHPSESQYLAFSKCYSSDPTIVTIGASGDCPVMVGNVATLSLVGKSKGTAQIIYQVDDAGKVHNLSPEYRVDVRVQ